MTPARARLLALAGTLLLISVAVRRFLALAEMIGTPGVSAFNLSGLTIFQVQPLEPLETLAGAVLLYLGLDSPERPRILRWGLILCAALAVWSILSGLLVVMQGLRLDGHVQVPLQGNSNALARGSLTLRLATQTLAPAVVGLLISIFGLSELKRDQQPARTSTQS